MDRKIEILVDIFMRDIIRHAEHAKVVCDKIINDDHDDLQMMVIMLKNSVQSLVSDYDKMSVLTVHFNDQ